MCGAAALAHLLRWDHYALLSERPDCMLRGATYVFFHFLINHDGQWTSSGKREIVTRAPLLVALDEYVYPHRGPFYVIALIVFQLLCCLLSHRTVQYVSLTARSRLVLEKYEHYLKSALIAWEVYHLKHFRKRGFSTYCFQHSFLRHSEISLAPYVAGYFAFAWIIT